MGDVAERVGRAGEQNSRIRGGLGGLGDEVAPVSAPQERISRQAIGASRCPR
jgi:hypothetical protein